MKICLIMIALLHLSQLLNHCLKLQILTIGARAMLLNRRIIKIFSQII